MSDPQTSGEDEAGLGQWYSSPFRRMLEDMDRMFESMQRTSFGGAAELGRGHWMSALDVRETNDAIIVEAEIPGIDPKDVHVECHDDVLTIRGRTEERREEGGLTSRQIPISPESPQDRAA